MIGFIKNFKNWVPAEVQYIVWIVLLASAVFLNVLGSTTVLGFLQTFLPVALGIIAVWILYAKKEFLVAYFLLFLLAYADQLGVFIRGIFSFNFGTSTFTSLPTWQTLVGMVGTIYLLMMIISNLIDTKIQFKYKKSSVMFPLLLAFIYGYFRLGFINAVVFLVPVIIALLFGSPLAASLFLLGNFISQPFQIINLISSGGIKFTSIFYWLYSIAAIYMIYLVIMLILKLLKRKEEI
ncbi:MAG: hypothetical protein JXC31_05070 [Acholeplasmataceae bacterium]|nr:hypothetical protein [Acholeplasmataceae bacterium]